MRETKLDGRLGRFHMSQATTDSIERAAQPGVLRRSSFAQCLDLLQLDQTLFFVQLRDP
jgi:hypothetical protein